MRIWKYGFITALLLLPFSLAAETPPASPVGFPAFFAKFQVALAKNDGESLAAMTQLPFPYDEGKLGKADYLKNLGKIFPAKTKACFAKAKRVKGQMGEYSVFCGEEIYLFQKNGADFQFTEIGAND